MRRTKIIVSLIGLAGLLFGLFPLTLAAQPKQPVVVRFDFADQAHLNAVAGELDIWEVQREAGYAVAAVTPEQYRWLEDLGYRLEVDVEKTEWLSPDAPLDGRFYYFDDYYTNPNGRYMVDFLQQTNATYPDIVELIDIGDAWMAGQPGEHDRDLWVLRITNEDPAFGPIENKPPFYLMANIHAREVTTPEMAIRYIKYLTSGYDGEGGYGIDPDSTWLVDWNVIYVEVSQNPDGHWRNETDISYYWRKNMNDTECPGGDFGIDLNRNHSFFWGCCGGSSGNPCSNTYRGPSRASEPETQAYQNYFATIFTDWNGPNGDDEYPQAAPDDASGVMITLHTYSDLILWPWGHTSTQAPNGAQLRTIGRKLAYFNNYTPQQGYNLYPTDGTTDDWSYGKFGVASFTFEIGPGYGACGGFFPDYECMEGEPGWPQNFWAENGPAFLYAHKIARTPYMTAYGPDTENVVVTPDTVLPGVPVQLTALITDHRYGGDPLQPIDGAEYFIDEPGADGTGTAMAPSDGSWGELSEDVEATVDTSGLAPGQHYILVHGLNDDGDWGPFTAVFLNVETGQCDPVESVSIDGPTILAVDETGLYTATYTPPTATLPVTITWDNGTVGDTAVYSWTVPGTHTLAVTASNNCGLVTDAFDVLVYEPCVPVSDAALVWTPLTPTVGEMITFTATATGTEPIAFTWGFGDGMGGSGMTATHTYTTSGDYFVTLTATNACGEQMVTGTMTVLPGCDPVHDVDFAYAPISPVLGMPIAFTATVTGTAPFTFSWDFGDGAMGNGMTATHTYTASGAYTVTLTALNACGEGSMQHVIMVEDVIVEYKLFLPIIVKS